MPGSAVDEGDFNRSFLHHPAGHGAKADGFDQDLVGNPFHVGKSLRGAVRGHLLGITPNRSFERYDPVFD